MVYSFRTLYQAHNIAQSSIATTLNNVPATLDLVVLRDASFLPTHILAVIDTPKSPIPAEAHATYYANIIPILTPVNFALFTSKVRTDLLPLFPDVSDTSTPYQLPVAQWNRQTQSLTITLPVVHFEVPHPPSFSLLLLFALGLHVRCPPDKLLESESGSSEAAHLPESSGASSRGADTPSPHPSPNGSLSGPSPSLPHTTLPPTDSPAPHTHNLHTTTGLLATYLLPTAVIEEYPAFETMSDVLADIQAAEELETFMEFNSGFWRNLLFIAPKDQEVEDIARVAFTVTRRAIRRKESREKEKRRRRELMKASYAV